LAIAISSWGKRVLGMEQGLTGRHIVLLRNEQGGGPGTLRQSAGLRLRSCDHRDAAGLRHPIQAGEGVLFERLGAALVHADPDQLAALGRRAGAGLLRVEPERVVRAMAGGCTDMRLPAGRAGNAVEESQSTWGLQLTRASVSRFTGAGVRVAILDSGIDLQHPDFKNRPIVSQCFVPNSVIDDGAGHGTYCAGVACGPISPAQPPRYGIASEAELFIGKVIGDDGSGTDGSILAGMDWALRSNCAVVSLSMGSPVTAGEPFSAIYEQVAQRALAGGTLIMAAAGNDSVRPEKIAPVDHPANCPSILAVAAIDAYLRIAPFSCGGMNADGGEVDIAAPGVAVRSAWPRPALYRTDSGTSMASPFAAGIAALIAQANPSARGSGLKALLTRGAQSLGLPARDVGAGLIVAP
jgi:subtilisin